MPNTKIEFLYRDAANWKTWNSIVIPGGITQEQIDRVMACRDDGEYFIPERLGLEANRWNSYDEELDHIWCQLYDHGIEATELAWTDDLSPEELVRRFELMKGRWEEKPMPFGFCGPVPCIED